jgi:hypothetical protein
MLCKFVTDELDLDCAVVGHTKQADEMRFFQGSFDRYTELEGAIRQTFGLTVAGAAASAASHTPSKEPPRKRMRVSLDKKVDLTESKHEVADNADGGHDILQVSTGPFESVYLRPLGRYVESVFLTTLSDQQTAAVGSKRKRTEQSVVSHEPSLGDGFNLDVRALLLQKCKLDYKTESVNLFMSAFHDKSDVVDAVRKRLDDLGWSMPQHIVKSSQAAFETDSYQTTESLVDKITWIGHVIVAFDWFETVMEML